MKICTVTGHQGTRFKFKYKDNNNGCKRLKKRMREQFILLYKEGIRDFWIGGGLGVDLWAGEILLRLREEPAYSEIILHTAIPFPGYDVKWDERSRLRMAFVVKHSASTQIIGTIDIPPAVCYRQRDRFLIDQADCLLAVYDNDRSIRNSVGTAVFLAEKRNIPIILIHPDTGIVTRTG